MIDHAEYPVVIMSCDGYSDVWPPLVQSIEKFWPDCPFPVFLCSERKNFEHPWIKNLQSGAPMGWAQMTTAILNQLSTKNVIYLQEDYILKGPIDNEKIYKLIEFYEREQAAYLRLIPFPAPDENVNEELGVGIIHPVSSYRTSLQAAIWDREIFLDLLDPNESGWDFERESVRRASKFERPFFSVEINSEIPNKNHHRYPLDYYSTAILQGKWQKEGVKILRAAGIDIDTSKRGCLTRWDFYFYHQRKTADGLKQKVLSWLDRNIFNRNRNFRKF